MKHIKSFFESVALKESAVVILKHNSGRILFLLRREGWCLPGGKLDDGETPIDGALRECQEETGINPQNLKYLGSSKSVNGRVVHVFSGTTNIDKVTLSSEHSSFKWIFKKNMFDLKLAGNTGEFLKMLD